MSFPIGDYDKAVAALRAVVADRDAKGRNETNDFYQQFPHGSQDLTFELHRRVQRILGAEKLGNSQVVYEDTLDLANYAIFLMMHLNKDSAAQNPAPSHLQIPRPDVAAALNKPGRFVPSNCSTAPRRLDPTEDSTAS